jgi:hypothetical protein
MRRTLNAYRYLPIRFFLLRKTASLDTSQLIKLSDQSESAFHFSLFLIGRRCSLFLVFYGEGVALVVKGSQLMSLFHIPN